MKIDASIFRVFNKRLSDYSPINKLDEFLIKNKSRINYRIKNDISKKENFSMNDINKNSEIDMDI